MVTGTCAEPVSEVWGWDKRTGFSQSEPILMQAVEYLLTQDSELRIEDKMCGFPKNAGGADKEEGKLMFYNKDTYPSPLGVGGY